jgi:phospholipid/cholesterol/gamma-HCH transport system substrate-binding protein
MMANNVAETVIGAVVLATAAGFVLYAGQASGLRMTSDSYQFGASFRSADGIMIGTDVRLAGIKVGSVTALELDPESYQALVSFTVRRDLQIPDDSDVKVASEGLLGGSFLEVTPGASEFNLADGDQFLNTQGSINILNLLSRLGAGK